MSAPVTLITGARKGIGRRLAEHYLAAGHSVIGCSRKASELRHERYQHFCVDVADTAAAREMFSEIEGRYGRLDHLVNNAAVAGINHFLLTPIEGVESIMRTNVVGNFLFSQEAARLMQRAAFGRIVNFSSFIVPLRLEGHAAYAASKAAVEMLTRMLAKELAPFGITVNCIGPTGTATDLMRGIPQAKVDAFVARQAVKRMTEFEDIFHGVDFFLRPESGFVTGQVVYLGGA